MSRVPPGYADLAARNLLPPRVARAILVSNSLPDAITPPPFQDSRPPRLSREEYNRQGRPSWRSRQEPRTPPGEPSATLPDEATLYGTNPDRFLPPPF